MFKTAADVRPLEEDLAEIGLLDPQSVIEATTQQNRFRRPSKPKTTGMAKQYAQHRAGKSQPSKLTQGNDRISNLIEEVDGELSSLAESAQIEVVKAFANAAILADILSERFLSIAEVLAEEEDDEDLASNFFELSNQFESLASDAADKAESLQSSLAEDAFDDIDMEIVEGDFKDMLTALLDGLDIYNDLTEEDDDKDDKKSKKKDDDEDDDKDDKKSKSKKDDDDDDDDDDDKDDKKEKKNPFAK